ncbi:hypothetical protein SXCC_01520 [Gluconacetobacter sp. SXCC-1]|nr:hypothetical protein SXCC_01520 [Gluconacetobacter sp. SXCC-1]
MSRIDGSPASWLWPDARATAWSPAGTAHGIRCLGCRIDVYYGHVM